MAYSGLLVAPRMLHLRVRDTLQHFIDFQKQKISLNILAKLQLQ